MASRTLLLVSAALLITSASGCTMIAHNEERRLSANGFQMKLADTPEKESHLESLKQRKLFPTRMDGNLVYVYADAKGCNCLYVGSEADYQRYQQMLITQHQIDEERDSAEELDDASMQWGTWGPWYRPIY